jgi:hypothetical protein
MADTNRPPYIGPPALTEDDAIYGRDWEREELRDLLLAHQIVLMHSPSGAGKTSLIQAGLIPEMKKKSFEILGPVRPGIGWRSADIQQTRYGFSMMRQLDERLPEGERRTPSDIASVRVGEYLVGRLRKEGAEKSGLLVIDQFEEVLTSDPTDVPTKRAFFQELGAALRASELSRLMVLFSIRDDYVGSLEPYLAHLPTGLETRFRLELLGKDEALAAIQKPADNAGVTFDDLAAEQVWKSLSEVRVLEPGEKKPTKRAGLYAEAVQLQVVCKQLWDAPRPDPERITADDVQLLGRMDDALGRFYSDAVTRALESPFAREQSHVSERAIRDWFEARLITAQDLRSQVMEGSEAADELPAEVIAALVNEHILREEPRAGRRFFELAHDRLIGPIRDNNRKWATLHATALATQADRWVDSDRKDELLLSAEEAQRAEPESKRELEFVTASKLYRTREEKRSREFEGRTDLARWGWGVIFAEDADPEIQNALEPLLIHRKQEAGSKDATRYRIFGAAQGVRKGDTAEAFLARQGALPGLPNASVVPYYLLIVGSPVSIPFEFQYGLSGQYAVGRVDFDTAEEYSRYARSVVLSETAGVRLPRRVGVFSTAHEGIAVTQMASERIGYPLVERLRTYSGWTVQSAMRQDATKSRLTSMLAGEDAPILLFVLSQGMWTQETDVDRVNTTGALICQNWQSGRVSGGHLFAAADLPSDAKLVGSIVCLVAAASAGMPVYDDFSPGLEKRKLTDRPFVAALPKKLLSHPNGGALAVIGHVDRNWTMSLLSSDGSKSSGLFESVLNSLINGHTVGSALACFGQLVLALAAAANEEAMSGSVVSTSRARKRLIALVDARNYIILGDPSVRLPITEERGVGGRPVLSDTGVKEALSPEAEVKPESEEVIFNGVGFTSAAYLLPPISAAEISSIVRGLSLERSRDAWLRQWYSVSAAHF